MNSTGNKSSFEKKAKATGMTFDEAKPKVEEELRFECPIYQTAERRNNQESMSGIDNFVTRIKTPLALGDKEIPDNLKRPEHWVKRGAAMLCQLSE